MANDKVALNDSELDQITGGSILPYQIQPGDTLEKIAATHNVTIDQLVKWNKIDNPNFITIGEKLKIYY